MRERNTTCHITTANGESRGGVCIAADGLILTLAAPRLSEHVQVLFEDSECRAVLHCDFENSVIALVKANRNEPFPSAKLATRLPVTGEAVYSCERLGKGKFRSASTYIANANAFILNGSVRIVTPPLGQFAEPQYTQPGSPLFNADGEVMAIADYPLEIDGQIITPWIVVSAIPGHIDTVGVLEPALGEVSSSREESSEEE